MKINDMVICISPDREDGKWIDAGTGEIDNCGPKQFDVLQIKNIKGDYLYFDEYPNNDDCFNKESFRVIPKKNESIYIKIESKKVIETEKIISN